jgi:GH15 family glucan-1,4-alpha-glucosidase
MTAADQMPAVHDGTRAGTAAAAVQAAVSAMLACQQPNGALVASPDFEQYHYCWLRDSSFAAYALDRCGEHDASAKYHDWASDAMAGIGDQISSAVERRLAGQAIAPHLLPPTRFNLDGSVAADDWPNFQVDGYGTWLWALREHLKSAGLESMPARWRASAELAAGYLAAFALDACYDVWEENGEGVHSSTLACVYGGLIAAAALLDDRDLLDRAREVQAYVRMTAGAAGRLQKSTLSAEVDASMIWLATPFDLVDDRDPLFEAAVREIADQLTFEGGVRRFPSDTFFGGGSWPVLTASLGWHQARTGDLSAARQCLAWVAEHIDMQGRLGEQFGGERRLPEKYREWIGQWGHPARDLLWSHAMYAVLILELSAAEASAAEASAAEASAAEASAANFMTSNRSTPHNGITNNSITNNSDDPTSLSQQQ